MSLAPHPRSIAANLLRLLAAWLAVILLVQGVAAAQALGLGPLHRHAAPDKATIAGHHHADGERHHHAAAEASVVHEADELDLGAFALTAALALLAFAALRAGAGRRRHVWPAAAPAAWRSRVVPLPLRPPRALRG